VFRDWISQQRPELDQARREAELTKLRDYRHTEYKEPSVEARQAYQRLRDAGGGTRALHTEAPGHTPVTLVDPADLALVLDTLEKYL
jgi:hypothetical protein